MKILIVHLSDLHMKEANNWLLEHVDKIYSVFQNTLTEMDAVFIVLTGDITISGKEEEYVQAGTLLEQIKQNIETKYQSLTSFIIVSGNHDCCHNKEKQKVREAILDMVRNKKDSCIEEDVIDKCCEVQAGFFKFLANYQDDSTVLYGDKLFKLMEYKIGEYRICFLCYNTAWMSELQEKVGNLYFPVSLCSKNSPEQPPSASISVLHHTPSWHDPDNARELRNHLEKTSDLILTGHEHIPSKSRKDNLNGVISIYIEGNILQSDSTDVKSGFNIIVLDLEKKKHKFEFYEWNGEYYEPLDKTDWIPYKSLVRSDKSNLIINDDFKIYLNDTGAPFQHPRKIDTLMLDDIYIYPDLREFTIGKSKETEILLETIHSDELFQIEKQDNKVLLIGPEKSGKTCLCKMLFKQYYSNNYVPILIDGRDIKTTSTDDLDKIIIETYVKQYSNDTKEFFIQLENTGKIIIIDDFDKARIHPKAKSLLLSRINKKYPNVILTANNLFQIAQILTAEEQEEFALEPYRQFEILPFGHLLRYRLIERWNILGIEDSFDESELIRKNDKTKKTIDTIIGKNIVPSYPLFLLTILQTVELGHPHDFKESVYGYYYETLITQAIGLVIKDNHKIDAYYNFLTLLANYLLENKTREISLDSLTEFHSWYCKQYGVSPYLREVFNLHELTANLKDARILDEHQGLYKFRYKFCYYFFAARYLSINITQDNIKRRISGMCNRLYNEDIANTIIFLTHHSKDPFILQELMSNGRQIFKEAPILELEKDISTINDMIDEVPLLVVKNMDTKDVREERLKRKDEAEMVNNQSMEATDVEISDIDESHPEDPSTLNRPDQLNAAFKTIETIGQILKNYHGSMKRMEKIELTEEAMMLGLRSTGALFIELNENIDALVSLVSIYMKKYETVDDDKTERRARVVLFNLYSLITLALLKKIASSIGSEYLSETYREILESYDCTSVHLVDITIKLDFYPAFPINEIQALKKRSSNNNLALYVLQRLVVDHLYMFETDFKDRQRICTILKIPMSTQQMITQATAQKKQDSTPN